MTQFIKSAAGEYVNVAHIAYLIISADTFHSDDRAPTYYVIAESDNEKFVDVLLSARYKTKKEAAEVLDDIMAQIASGEKIIVPADSDTEDEVY